MFNENNIIYPKKAGTYTLTITTEDKVVTRDVTLENQYVITLPKIKSKYQDPNDNMKVNVYNNETCKPSLVYNTTRASHDVELVYDQDFMSVTYTGNGASAYLTITAKQVGESPITLIYGSGTDQQKEITFIVNTETSSSSSRISKILNYYKKGFSHVALFFVLGVGTLLLALYALYKWPFGVRLGVLLGFGLVWGAIEEFIQKFIPGRSPLWKDIFFYDWFGYLIGIAFITIAILCFVILRGAIQNHRSKKEKIEIESPEKE